MIGPLGAAEINTTGRDYKEKGLKVPYYAGEVVLSSVDMR